MFCILAHTLPFSAWNSTHPRIQKLKLGGVSRHLRATLKAYGREHTPEHSTTCPLHVYMCCALYRQPADPVMLEGCSWAYGPYALGCNLRSCSTLLQPPSTLLASHRCRPSLVSGLSLDESAHHRRTNNLLSLHAQYFSFDVSYRMHFAATGRLELCLLHPGSS